MKKIGLTQRVEVIDDYQERRDCLDQNWFHLMLDLGFMPIALPNLSASEDIDSYLSSLNLDGVILTGGNDLGWTNSPRAANERDHFESVLIEHCLQHEKPVLGVCRGMQMINLHFGGQLIKLAGHVTKNHTIRLDNGSCYQVNSYHDWGIAEASLSDSLAAMGWAEDGTVEYLKHKTHALTGMMWHPERANDDSDIGTAIIKETFK